MSVDVFDCGSVIDAVVSWGDLNDISYWLLDIFSLFLFYFMLTIFTMQLDVGLMEISSIHLP